MKKLFAICSLLFIQASLLAQDYTGVWEGWFSTDMIPSLGRRTFFLHMELKQEGSSIIGVCYNSSIENKGKLQVVYKVSGRLGKKNKFIFRLTNDGIVEDYLPTGVAAVFYEFHCMYKATDTAEIIQGNWYPNGIPSPRSDGAGGPFIVKRVANTPTMAAMEIFEYDNRTKKHAAKMDTTTGNSKQLDYYQRKDSVFAKVISPVKNVSLIIYDNAIIDGDTISLYINDSLVMAHKGLSTKPIEYLLPIEKGKTYKVSLFAENLGSIPPNTAYLYLKFSNNSGMDTYLSCNKQQNASITIKLQDD